MNATIRVEQRGPDVIASREFRCRSQILRPDGHLIMALKVSLVELHKVRFNNTLSGQSADQDRKAFVGQSDATECGWVADDVFAERIGQQRKIPRQVESLTEVTGQERPTPILPLGEQHAWRISYRRGRRAVISRGRPPTHERFTVIIC